MQLFFRLIAILLVLTTGGVFQTLAFASDGTDACAGEEDEGRCADCASDCSLCLCCPLRAAPATPPLVEAAIDAPLPEPVPTTIGEPVPSGVGADIFQPPRA
jgi:hypothetical protein